MNTQKTVMGRVGRDDGQMMGSKAWGRQSEDHFVVKLDLNKQSIDVIAPGQPNNIRNAIVWTVREVLRGTYKVDDEISVECEKTKLRIKIYAIL